MHRTVQAEAVCCAILGRGYGLRAVSAADAEGGAVKRQLFVTRTILFRGQQQVETALALIPNLPLDDANPLEMIVREVQPIRKKSQNDLMWSGPLFDIAEQAYYKGRKYSDVLWHETFKRLYLPEEFDAELCKDRYRKWDFDRDGERVLVGSTKDLTVKGFAQYLEQVIADGASMGVQFSASPNERRAA